MPGIADLERTVGAEAYPEALEVLAAIDAARWPVTEQELVEWGLRGVPRTLRALRDVIASSVDEPPRYSVEDAETSKWMRENDRGRHAMREAHRRIATWAFRDVRTANSPTSIYAARWVAYHARRAGDDVAAELHASPTVAKAMLDAAHNLEGRDQIAALEDCLLVLDLGRARGTMRAPGLTFRAHLLLGEALESTWQSRQALAHFDAALAHGAAAREAEVAAVGDHEIADARARRCRAVLRLGDAEGAFNDAHDLLSTIPAIEADWALVTRGLALGTQGRALGAMGRVDDAVERYSQAIRLLEAPAGRSAPARQVLAEVLHSFASAAMQSDPRFAYERAVEAVRWALCDAPGAADGPGTFNVVEALRTASRAASHLGEPEIAVRHAKEAVARVSPLAIKDPVRWAGLHAVCQCELATATFGVAAQDGVAMLAAAVDALRLHVEGTQQGEWLPDLASAAGTLSMWVREPGSREEYSRLAVVAAEAIAPGLPRDVSVAHATCARRAWALDVGESTEALVAAGREIHARRHIVAAEARREEVRALAQALLWRGEALRAFGDQDGRIADYDEAAALLGELVDVGHARNWDAARRAEDRVMLGRTLQHAAVASCAAGRPADACAYMARVREVLASPECDGNADAEEQRERERKLRQDDAVRREATEADAAHRAAAAVWPSPLPLQFDVAGALGIRRGDALAPYYHHIIVKCAAGEWRLTDCHCDECLKQAERFLRSPRGSPPRLASWLAALGVRSVSYSSNNCLGLLQPEGASTLLAALRDVGVQVIGG